jgi:hypothetical protein
LSSGYAAVLGSVRQWADGKLDAGEIRTDPEAIALVDSFKDQMADQLGAMQPPCRASACQLDA